MIDTNICCFIGHLASDPESPEGKTYVTFMLAVQWEGKDGSQGSEGIGCVAFGDTAKNCQEHLSEGSRVHVLTSYSTQDYTDDNGVAMKVPQFIVRDVQIL